MIGDYDEVCSLRLSVVDVLVEEEEPYQLGKNRQLPPDHSQFSSPVSSYTYITEC